MTSARTHLKKPLERGFTLIEVVGAVAIVGIWFLVLSTSAFNGLSAESRVQRLLEASLIADEALADGEAQALLGLPIELDTSAYGDLDFDGEPEYAVIVTSEPFDPLTRLTAVNPQRGGAAFVDPTSAGADPAAPSLLSMQRLRIEVYLEADIEEDDELTFPLAARTTFSIDAASLALLAPNEAPLPARDATSDAAGLESPLQ